MLLKINENNVYLEFLLEENSCAKLLHMSCFENSNDKILEDKKARHYSIMDLHISGYNQDDHHGNKHTGCNPSQMLKYQSYNDYENEHGRKIEIYQEYNGIEAVTHFQFYNNISIVRTWNEVKNNTQEILPIEYISSFTLVGLTENGNVPRDKSGHIFIPHNTWSGENQWKEYTLNELGYDLLRFFSMKKISLQKTGSWTCSEHLPMGSYYNTELNKTITWQIETTGSWQWELSDVAEELYLKLSGPTFQENNFLKKLKPNESFISAPCAVSVVNGDFEKSIQEITKYRRCIRRKNPDNENLPIIFNDYMNCLMGNPTTEKLLPLIDAAADTGSEYFCIDCGWYDDGPWWDGVGEWKEAQTRFGGKLNEVISYIRQKNMIPGLWLEIESMGINCPLVKTTPLDWFFQRNGKPVIDHSRYHLDFRNPSVCNHATSIIDRVVNEYGAGYIKMDYNIDIGVGTDLNSDSFGEGLLEHTRAYTEWIKEIFAKYPDLIIENCGSGGLRMEYNMLAQHSIQSVSDQGNYIKMASIAANSSTSCCPEQAAIWSYPLITGTDEEVAFNMVNAMLFRVHQSGYLGQIEKSRMDLVKEGLNCYRKIRDDIKTSVPFWPIGLATMSSRYIAFGLENNNKKYVSVWCTKDGEEKNVKIPIKSNSKNINVNCLYPTSLPTKYTWNNDEKYIEIELKEKTARFFEIVEL